MSRRTARCGTSFPAAGFGAVEAREVRTRLAELPAPVVLVLDDFHEITSDQVLEAFGQLVDHLPDTVRLVMLTRSDPLLRLHRLRVSGQLTEIRTDDLAFTEQETAELFDLQGIHLRAEQLGVLRARTQGWPAGLRLAAMSLDPADVDGGIARFSGNDRSVADYLVGEVIDRLSAEDRDFLLKTSITEKINGDLADLPDRADRQPGDAGEAGRRQRLRGRARRAERMVQLPPAAAGAAAAPARPGAADGAYAELHRRPRSWMAQHGEPIESIRHSILAGDLQGAGRTLLSVMPQILSAEGPALAAAIEPLASTASRQANPELAAGLGDGAICTGSNCTAMLQDATEAREFLDEAADDVRPSAEVVIALFEMAAARSRGDAANGAWRPRTAPSTTWIGPRGGWFRPAGTSGPSPTSTSAARSCGRAISARPNRFCADSAPGGAGARPAAAEPERHRPPGRRSRRCRVAAGRHIAGPRRASASSNAAAGRPNRRRWRPSWRSASSSSRGIGPPRRPRTSTAG